jgi:hypothetical protein
MNGLTNDDIDILVESLDSWVQRRQSGEMLGDLLEGLLLSKGADVDVAKAKTERTARKEQAKMKEKEEMELATILKAKLILMKARG